jgi:hypothetical protein
MAYVLKLVRTADYVADVDSLDLLSGGFSLAIDGYQPTVAPLSATSVSEVITINIKSTSSDALAALVKTLDAKLQQMQYWIDNPSVERYQIYLRVKLSGETNTRQSLLVNITPETNVRVFNPGELTSNFIGEYSIGVERMPYWENLHNSRNQWQALSNVDCITGKAALNNVDGDVASRIGCMEIMPQSFNRRGQFWAGFKSARMSDPGYFASVWSCALGDAISADTFGTVTASAVSGTALACTFGTTSALTLRSIIKVSDVTSYISDQRGSYNVLLRCYLSSTSAQVRIVYGYYNDSFNYFVNPVYRSLVPIDTTLLGYQMYDVGQVTIPPQRSNALTDWSNMAIGIEAERTGSQGTLYLDCLKLIPVDDGAIKVTGDAFSGTDKVRVYHYGDDTVVSEQIDEASGTALASPATVTGALVSSPINWGLPLGSGYLIFANNSGSIGDKCNVSFDVVPRFRTLAGSI